MSDHYAVDCLAAERGFPVDDDDCRTLALTLACPNCRSLHHISVIQWPGNAEYHPLICCVCLGPLGSVRCDVGYPLLTATTIGERFRRQPRRGFTLFGLPRASTT